MLNSNDPKIFSEYIYNFPKLKLNYKKNNTYLVIEVTASFCSLSKVSTACCNSRGNSFGAISILFKTSLGLGEGKS